MKASLMWLGVRLAFTLLFLFWFLLSNAGAQPADLNNRIAEVLRYTGVENPVPADVARMVKLWTMAQDPSLTPEQRRATFQELYTFYTQLHGQVVTPRMQGLSQAAATIYAGEDAWT